MLLHLTKSYVSTILLAFLFSILFITSIYAQKGITNQGSIICKQKYALCTSAPCIRIPGIKDKTLCFCVVKKGSSLGKTSCDRRKPSITKGGIKQIVSTFSLAQFGTKKTLTCKNGTPWADCLDMPCIISPTNPSQSVCTCKLVRSGSYATLGGNCNTKNCGKTIWSGAIPSANLMNVNAIQQVLQPGYMSNNACPVK